MKKVIFFILCITLIGCSHSISRKAAIQSMQTDNWEKANTQLSDGTLFYYEFKNVTPSYADATSKELLLIKFTKQDSTHFYQIEISMEQVLPIAIKDLIEEEQISSIWGKIINHYIIE
jgi:hypothetical protein